MKARRKTNKRFDCVASKREAQSRIYRKIKGMTPEEEAAYFDRAVKNGPFREMWSELAQQGRRAVGSGKLRRRSA